jgi:hypothetical protein
MARRRYQRGLSFAKTPQQLNLLLVTCYAISPYVIDFKRTLNSGEAQGLSLCSTRFIAYRKRLDEFRANLLSDQEAARHSGQTELPTTPDGLLLRDTRRCKLA